MNEQEYIKTRLDDQITWYSNKATKNKLYNYWIKGSVITLSATIPLVAGTEFCSTIKNLILGILGSLIAILSGFSGVFKFQENWTEYRITSETLKHEKFLYQTKSGPYIEHPDSFNLLVTRIENLVSKENSIWSQYINKQN